jgi:hypothetical protein
MAWAIIVRGSAERAELGPGQELLCDGVLDGRTLSCHLSLDCWGYACSELACMSSATRRLVFGGAQWRVEGRSWQCVLRCAWGLLSELRGCRGGREKQVSSHTARVL